jgi:hypothetical protein
VVDAINHAASLTIRTGDMDSIDCKQAWAAAVDAAKAAAAAGLSDTSLAEVVEQVRRQYSSDPVLWLAIIRKLLW